MESQNHKKIYIGTMIYGGIGGVLFLLIFLTISMIARTYAFYNFVAFASRPFFYVLGYFSLVTFVIGPPLLILYWAVLGAVIALILDSFFLSIFRKRKTNIATSE